MPSSSSLARAIQMPEASAPTARFTQRTRTLMTTQNGEHIDDVDAQLPRQDVLIPSSAASNRHRSGNESPTSASVSPVVSTQNTASHYLGTAAAIQSHQQNIYTYYPGQDVLPVNAPSSYRPSVPTSNQHIRQQYVPSTPSSGISFYYHNGTQINIQPERLRTNLATFDSSKLAENYGIPTKFPPAPRINSVTDKSTITTTSPYRESAPTSAPAPAPASVPQHVPTLQSSQQTNPNTLNSYRSLVNDYLQMLGKDQRSEAQAAAQAAAKAPIFDFIGTNTMERSPAGGEILNFEELLGGTSMADEFPTPPWTTETNEFLTSPYIDDDTPYEPFLKTPGQPALDSFMSSPMVDCDQPLFGGEYSYEGENASKTSTTISGVPPPNVICSESTTVDNLFDDLIQMPETPLTPFVSPLMEDMSEPESARRGGRNGTRKNLKPESLIPLDAPTQPRKYVGPSRTSRKALTDNVVKKRARSVVFADEEELPIDSAPATKEEQDQIDAKRRQNTLAARRSRKRKLEYTRNLEESCERERHEKEIWRERALVVRRQLISLGYPEPFREEL